MKGVEAAAIHGGKEQEERHLAVDEFRQGKKDVLVATDVASKGLDFENIQHVINFDMPDDIENYVRRIGRTGRSMNRGLATTFINRGVDLSVLLDLKHLLLEANQEVPLFLRAVESETEKQLTVGENPDDKGCAYCSGLGHRIADCPKLESVQNKVAQTVTRKDFLSGGGEW